MKYFFCISFLLAGMLVAQETVTLEAVVANRQLWPKEVVVSVPHEVPIVVNGKASGSMQAGAGRTYKVKTVSAAGVQVDAMGQTLTFPATDTDLMTRAEAQDARLKEIAAAPAPAVAPAAPVAAATPKPTPTPAEATNILARNLGDSLVVLDGKKLKPFDSATLGNKKYLAVYYSASWCPPCRAFTPDLVSWYKRKKSSLDKFDLVFVSNDKSEDAMLSYMIDDKMAWPAVKFDQKGSSALSGFGGRGIPCLVVLDEKGDVVLHSYVNGEYVGPTKVLKEFDKLLKDS